MGKQEEAQNIDSAEGEFLHEKVGYPHIIKSENLHNNIQYRSKLHTQEFPADTLDSKKVRHPPYLKIELDERVGEVAVTMREAV